MFSSAGEAVQGLTGGDGCDRRAEVLLSTACEGGDAVELFVEVAANGMFGVGGRTMISAPDPDRSFTLKTCCLKGEVSVCVNCIVSESHTLASDPAQH